MAGHGRQVHNQAVRRSVGTSGAAARADGAVAAARGQSVPALPAVLAALLEDAVAAKPTLTEADFERAARALGVAVAAIKAVTEVEAPKGGFLATGEPTILFERHKFRQYTGGKWDKQHPDLSNRTPGGYGPVSAQHGRLQRAAELDRDAALKATSWGRFQILGVNHVQAGFAKLQDFINAMYRGEGAQLDAFVSFIKADTALHAALKACDWARFARGYNGPTYAKNQYDKKLAAAFKKYGGSSR